MSYAEACAASSSAVQLPVRHRLSHGTPQITQRVGGASSKVGVCIAIAAGLRATACAYYKSSGGSWRGCGSERAGWERALGEASGDDSLAHQRRGGDSGMPSRRSLARGSRGAVGGMSVAAVPACESKTEVDLRVAGHSAVPSTQGALRSMLDDGSWQNYRKAGFIALVQAMHWTKPAKSHLAEPKHTKQLKQCMSPAQCEFAWTQWQN